MDDDATLKAAEAADSTKPPCYPFDVPSDTKTIKHAHVDVLINAGSFGVRKVYPFRPGCDSPPERHFNRECLVNEALKISVCVHLLVADWIRTEGKDGWNFGILRFPYMPYTLEEIRKNPKLSYSDVDVVVAAMHMITGLRHLHRLGIIYADPKLDNTFVDANGIVKLGDFDVSMFQNNVGEEVMRGTKRCLDPRVFAEYTPDFASDIWGLAVAFWELVTRQRFLCNLRTDQLCQFHNAGQWTLPQPIGEHFIVGIINSCTQHVEIRPKAEQLATCLGEIVKKEPYCSHVGFKPVTSGSEQAQKPQGLENVKVLDCEIYEAFRYNGDAMQNGVVDCQTGSDAQFRPPSLGSLSIGAPSSKSACSHRSEISIRLALPNAAAMQNETVECQTGSDAEFDTPSIYSSLSDPASSKSACSHRSEISIRPALPNAAAMQDETVECQTGSDAQFRPPSAGAVSIDAASSKVVCNHTSEISIPPAEPKTTVKLNGWQITKRVWYRMRHGTRIAPDLESQPLITRLNKTQGKRWNSRIKSGKAKVIKRVKAVLYTDWFNKSATHNPAKGISEASTVATCTPLLSSISAASRAISFKSDPTGLSAMKEARDRQVNNWPEEMGATSTPVQGVGSATATTSLASTLKATAELPSEPIDLAVGGKPRDDDNPEFYPEEPDETLLPKSEEPNRPLPKVGFQSEVSLQEKTALENQQPELTGKEAADGINVGKGTIVGTLKKPTETNNELEQHELFTQHTPVEPEVGTPNEDDDGWPREGLLPNTMSPHATEAAGLSGFHKVVPQRNVDTAVAEPRKYFVAHERTEREITPLVFSVANPVGDKDIAEVDEHHILGAASTNSPKHSENSDQAFLPNLAPKFELIDDEEDAVGQSLVHPEFEAETCPFCGEKSLIPDTGSDITTLSDHDEGIELIKEEENCLLCLQTRVRSDSAGADAIRVPAEDARLGHDHFDLIRFDDLQEVGNTSMPFEWRSSSSTALPETATMGPSQAVVPDNLAFAPSHHRSASAGALGVHEEGTPLERIWSSLIHKRRLDPEIQN